MRGRCIMIEVPAGLHRIVLRKTDYDVTVVDGVEFRKGKSSVVKWRMGEGVSSDVWDLEIRFLDFHF